MQLHAQRTEYSNTTSKQIYSIFESNVKINKTKQNKM